MPPKAKAPVADPKPPRTARPAPEIAPPEAAAGVRRNMTPEESAHLRIEYGKRLRQARIAAGWPVLAEAASHAGIHPVVMTQMETGRSAPSMATLDKLVTLLGLDTAILFRGIDYRTPAKP